MAAPGSCGVRSFWEAGQGLRGSAVLSFLEAEAGRAVAKSSRPREPHVQLYGTALKKDGGPRWTPTGAQA